MEKPDFDGSEPNGLDIEFYNYLDQQENEKDDREKLEALRPAAEARLQRELDARDFPRVYDTDPKTRDELMIETALELAEYYQEEAEADPEGFPISQDEDIRKIALTMATEFVHTQQQEETSIANTVRAQLQLYWQELDAGKSEAEIAPEFDDRKKKVMAVMLSTNPAVYDDGWYEIVRDIMPGKALDLSLPEDTEYMKEAIEVVEAKNRESHRLAGDIESVLLRVQSQAGNPPNNPMEVTFLRTAASEFRAIIDRQSAGQDNARAERERQLWEIAREYEIDDEAVRQIIAIAAAENPL